MDEIFGRFDALTAQVCQCHDTDCVLKLIDERNRYGYELEQRHYDMQWVTSQDGMRVKRTQTEFMQCAQRILVPAEAAKKASTIDEEKIFKPVTELRDRMCSCTDRACGNQVIRDAKRYLDEIAHMPLEDDQQSRLKAITDKYAECASRLYKTTP